VAVFWGFAGTVNGQLMGIRPTLMAA